MRPHRQDSIDQQSNKRPLYLQVVDELSDMIGELDPGSYLPSEPKLAKQLGVSRATLREAMRVFEGRGLIIRRQGVGTLVTAPPQIIESGIETLESVESQAKRVGLQVKMADLNIDRRPPTAQEKQCFRLIDGAVVVEVARVIATVERPVAYLIDVLPEGLFPTNNEDENFRGSVLDLMIQRKHPSISHAQTEVTAVSAPPNVAQQLQIQRGDVLLCLEGWLYTQGGVIIDHTFSYYLPGTFRFQVLRRPDEVNKVGQ